MPRRQKQEDENLIPIPPPAATLEGMEDQMVAMAMQRIALRISNDSASSAELVHFARLGSNKHKLEEDELRQKNVVLEARVKEMEARGTSEAMYAEALAAFKGYSGQEPVELDDDDEW